MRLLRSVGPATFSTVAAVTAAAAVTLVGFTQLAQAIGEPAAEPRSARSIAAAAPCSGPARVSVRMTDSADEHEADRLRIEVSRARPGSRWTLSIHTYEGDNGHVATYPAQKANDKGRWIAHGSGQHFYVEVDVFATSRAGQACEVSLEGQVGS